MIEEQMALPAGETYEVSAQEKSAVKDWLEKVKAAEKKWDKRFKKMRQNAQIVRLGTSDTEWKISKKYIANVIQKHIHTRTASLYAKNPKAVAKRRPQLDYQIWDGTPQSLNMAQQAVQAAQMGMVPPNPMTQQAEMLIQDAQQGMQRRSQVDRFARTLELVYQYMTDEQTVGYKKQMKRLVRRALTAGVGYVKLDFQRAMGRDAVTERAIADSKERLAHLDSMAQAVNDPDTDYSPEEIEVFKSHLESALAAYEQQPEIVLREGLVFDFPRSWSVIPSPNTASISGWEGTDWLAQVFYYTPQEVKERFDVDLGSKFKGYNLDGREASEDSPFVDSSGKALKREQSGSFAKVFEIQDKKTGLFYYVCDGYDCYLQPPSQPPVYMERFFTIFELTFNDIEESEDENNEYTIFPPSDVDLLIDAQMERNRSREALREHRIANRPQYASTVALSETDEDSLAIGKAHDVIKFMDLPPGSDISKVFQQIRKMGVDPNLYDVSQVMDDMGLVASSASEQAMGLASKGTATAANISESTRMGTVDSNRDDLDMFLTEIARAGGQLLMSEMQPESVMEIVGPGAFWPVLSREQIAKEVTLQIQAGSSGRPNKAQDANNLQLLMPFITQVPGISPTAIARKLMQVVDDSMDMDEFFDPSGMSINAMNAVAQASATQIGGPQPPSDRPEDQGGAGQNNAPKARTDDGRQNMYPV